MRDDLDRVFQSEPQTHGQGWVMTTHGTGNSVQAQHHTNGLARRRGLPARVDLAAVKRA